MTNKKNQTRAQVAVEFLAKPIEVQLWYAKEYAFLLKAGYIDRDKYNLIDFYRRYRLTSEAQREELRIGLRHLGGSLTKIAQDLIDVFADFFAGKPKK